MIAHSLRRTALIWVSATLVTVASAAHGQHGPVLPPIHPLGPIVATATDSFKNLWGVRALPGGRVLVNDAIGRKLVLYDSTLTHPTVVIDASNTTARRYPTNNNGGLFAYFGDSTLFVDLSALAFLVIDPHGTIARVMSVANTPVVSNRGFFIDPKNRFVSVVNGAIAVAKPPLPGTADSLWLFPDSAPILRDDILSHRRDTVAFVNQPKSYPMTCPTDPEGFEWCDWGTNPLPQADAWAQLPDGTVAVVRVLDYHVEWISPDGTRTSSPRIPHDWHHYSDSEKTAIVDSVQAALAAKPTTQRSTKDGVTKTRQVVTHVMDPADLPDYVRAFDRALADADGNLWVRVVTAPNAGGVYDLINRKGELFDRVQVPGGVSIAGFGPGVVYLSSQLAGTVSLERVRIR